MMPTRGASRPRAVMAKASQLDRLQRRRMGTLASFQLSARAANRYDKALGLFFSWLAAEGRELPERTEDFDLHVCAWIEHCWQEGEGRGRAADVICGLPWVGPNLKKRLNESWGLLKA